ncbi:uncharacterized protein LOC144167695 [Haemaphysalis longicornis]
MVAPVPAQYSENETHKAAVIIEAVSIPPKQCEQPQQGPKDAQHSGLFQGGETSSGSQPGSAAQQRHSPGYSSFVDESDVVVLRLLELVHRVLLFGMKLLKSHGRYAYSAS